MLSKRVYQRDESRTNPGPSQDDIILLPTPAPVSAFVLWLIENEEVHGLSRRKLWCLYHEFCLFTDTPPLTEAQLHRRKKAAGIERYREPVGTRPWRYKVHTADVVALSSKR